MSKIITEQKYSLCDLEIVPAYQTMVQSRKECNPYWQNELNEDVLPLFTAPMDSVCDDKNYKFFEQNHIIPIIHRNVSLDTRVDLAFESKWCAYSLDEFEELFCKEDSIIYKYGEKQTIYALIDVANGHMSKIFSLAATAKRLALDLNVNLVLMSGNIANPETYKLYCDAGIDYVRVSIGTGACCITTANTAVGYPNASLISEMAKLKDEYHKHSNADNEDNDIFVQTKIIADGGIRNYSDITVALACGADYCMVGSVFAAFFESCSKLTLDYELIDSIYMVDDMKINNINGITTYQFSVCDGSEHAENSQSVLKEIFDKYSIPQERINVNSEYSIEFSVTRKELFNSEDLKRFIIKNCKLAKTAHGMSTKEAQIGRMKSLGQEVDTSKLKTSEGKTIKRRVEYTCQQWADNFTSYLRSAMSYTSCFNLLEFTNNCTLVVKSYGTQMSVNK